MPPNTFAFYMAVENSCTFSTTCPGFAKIEFSVPLPEPDPMASELESPALNSEPSNSWRRCGWETRLIHEGEDDQPMGAIVPPLFQSAVFTHASLSSFEAASENPNGADPVYSPWGNPTVALVERKFAAMDGCEAAKLTGDGMAAIGTALLSCLKTGAHVVTLDSTYNTTLRNLGEVFSRYGVTFTMVDGRDPQTIFDAVRPETQLIYLESPSSLLFRLQDLRKVAAFAKQRNITTMIDNTYSTPLLQRPAELGIDIVVQSTSKYLGGHADLNGGLICSTKDRIDRLAINEVKLFGTIMAPFVAWLLLRGLRTLPLRLKQVSETANRIAGWLESRPDVRNVHHVGLKSYPQRELFLSQMEGSTGLFSFEPAWSEHEKTRRFVEALKVFRIGVSWGGPFSLVLPTAYQHQGAEDTYPLIRLYCGLETPEDLLRDLQQAFDAVYG